LARRIHTANVKERDLDGSPVNASDSVLKILHERPDECAYETLTRRQKIILGVALIALATLAMLQLYWLLLVLNAIVITFYIVHSTYKFWLVWRSLEHKREFTFSAEELAALDPDKLPTYTILLPLYREAAVLPSLVASLTKLDYPTHKLIIMLLIEEDDEETKQACNTLDLPAHFLPVIVPHSLPKTKPKACNYGLYACDSDLLVIYDAEDRPEPDQLKKAAAAFARLPDDVVCLQAKLNYYNQRHNLLTRWFTAEYSVWFDLFLPGLTSTRAPIPLGGTSNHFRVAVLKDLGGWDPFNVTEDCDLGVRMHKHGYHTAMIDSTTWEEANGELFSWLRQRSRWVKGYMQTYLVHTRYPLQLLRQLGHADHFSFQMTIGGSILCFLVNPIYWLMTMTWFTMQPEIISAMFPPVIFALGSLCLFVGNFVFVYLSVAGCAHRGYYDLVKYAVLTPLYWLLMSIGAYKALAQLITRPHYWEKTDHGQFGGSKGVSVE
jgi:cellulose synthase/poly-beta-1,6-N-acetylglucosamine synthase-like glycosyltransferase